MHIPKGKENKEMRTEIKETIAKIEREGKGHAARTRAYMKAIEKADRRNELMGVVISFSQDCSAYKISWEEFEKLHKASEKRLRAEFA